MSLQETSRYTVEITLTTELGECPTKDVMESLLETQMSGILDEDTGLRYVMGFVTAIDGGEDEPWNVFPWDEYLH